MRWFDEAVSAGLREPNAMALTTVNKEGKPYDFLSFKCFFFDIVIHLPLVIFRMIIVHLCNMCSSSRMVLLKGVDKQGFVWYVSRLLSVFLPFQEVSLKIRTHALMSSCIGTQIMVAGKHMTYLRIRMQPSFSTGMR